jgi:gliding motility-associated-like protein
MNKLIFVLSLLLLGNASAQIVTPFTKRFDATQKGNIDFVSNTIVQCDGGGGGGANCANLITDVAPTVYPYSQNNDHTSMYVDVDGDPTTFSSSSDSIDLPQCSEVLWAGLYWGAQRLSSDPGYDDRDKLKLKVDGGNYIDLTADWFIDNTAGYASYHCFKDVTHIVKNNPHNAVYTVANMYAMVGPNNQWGAWNIVVVYRNELLTMRNLTVYDGVANVSGSTNVDIPISGFLAPISGPVTFDIGVFAYDGDRGFDGDQLLFDGGSGFQNVSNTTNPVNDVFNSTNTIRGVESTSQNPLFFNNISYDADVFSPDNSTKNWIGNSATSCVIRETTGGEAILSQVITMAIDVYEPDVRASVSVTDLNGGVVNPGDVLEYRVKGVNLGSDSSINTFITDTLEYNAIYIPGSINIVHGAITGVQTDAAGDDVGEYDALNRTVKVRIGTGANATMGGLVNNDLLGTDSTVFTFRVRATTDCIALACDNVLNNQANIFGTGNVSGHAFSNKSNPDIFDGLGCPILGETATPINAALCMLPKDTTVTPYFCLGTPFVDLPYSGYTFYDSLGNAVTSAGSNGVYYAINEAYVGCVDTVVVTVDSVVNCDVDNDGVSNAVDIDDDNDGIPDVQEDLNLDGDNDPMTNPTDTDGDGIPDVYDLDSDNDGIPDLVEAGGVDVNGDGQVDTYQDEDNDGIPDVVDTSTQGCADTTPMDDICDANQGGVDTDGDGVQDTDDNDADGNGMDDLMETNPLTNPDTDGDGVNDVVDLDSDNDGITDLVEVGGVDANGDGQVDYGTPGDASTMADVDGDGFADIVDEDDNTSVGINDGGTNHNIADTDGDGIDNYLDLDSDNDGIADLVEAGGVDPDGDGRVPTNGNGTLVADADNDGLTDDPVVDTDNDGIADQPVDTDVVGGVSITNPDSDLDGVNDYLDLDSDNDGIADLVEAGGVDGDGDGHVDYPTPGDASTMVDADNDGLTDGLVKDTNNDGSADQPIDVDVTGGVAIANPDTDNDGLADVLDIDADNDGIVDNIEGQSTVGYVAPNGTDSDGDGLDDAYDGDDENTVGISGGLGTPIIPNDNDGDLSPDYVDTDADNDGESDVIEGWDANNDGVTDVVLSGLDSDNDGLDDAFETIVLDAVTGSDGSNVTNGGTVPADFPDHDTPGTLELDWRDGDTDGDGVADIADLDNDNDGIPDVEEDFNLDGDNDPTTNPTDTDGDGIPDYLDLDSDNDGIADLTEAGGTDLDKDGRIDTMEDDDLDGIPNIMDVDYTLGADANNDGIDDSVQGGTDSDGDGIQDSDDPDADGDGLADVVDNLDSPDNGGVTEVTSGSPLVNPDSDGDGILDVLDLDSDNDGITDIIEAGGGDANGDGQVDYDTPGDATTMADVDVDGYADAVDPENEITTVNGDGGNPHPSPDTDFDGVPDQLDLDSDNDGITDIIEAGSEDPDGDGRVPVNAGGTLVTDADNDGLTDNPVVDTNSDGVADQPVDVDVTGGVAVVPVNTDGTGKPDYLDLDSDDDGITDIIEAGGVDADGDGHVDYPTPGDASTMTDVDNDGLTDDLVVDTNNDGVADQPIDVDVMGGVAITNPDTDHDGLTDVIDIDADNDGIVDNIESQTTTGYIAPLGTDVDVDGLDDAYDADNDSVVGIGGGTGVAVVPVNTDNVDTPDYIDLDSDNDGQADVEEGWDMNGDDDLIGDLQPSGNDSDNDGLDDAFDVDGTSSVNNGGGTNNGQTPTDGTISNADNLSTIELDWREGDADGDGVADIADLDDDNDGVPDAEEDLNLDGDNDPTTNPTDTDGDGIPNYLDLDSDNDGIADLTEAGGVDLDKDGRIDTMEDDDLDGIPNIIDVDYTMGTDANNDGIDDSVQGGTDSDGDGIQDSDDPDADGDGLADVVDNIDSPNNGSIVEITSGTPLKNPDSDGDGILDVLDLDSDNDGITDIVEAGGGDINGDGQVDYNTPGDATTMTDVDVDGYADAVDPENEITTVNGDGGNPHPIPDTDFDGVPDQLDLDSDNDGITDIVESGSEDPDRDGRVPVDVGEALITDADNDGLTDSPIVDTDNDGTADQPVDVDVTGGVAVDPVNTDGTGKPDYLDLDSDDDGITDVIEAGGVDADGDGHVDYPTPGDASTMTDVDNDGLTDDPVVDTNNDGVADQPIDVDVMGGVAITNPDTDNDGLTDVIDIDADNDGIVDNIESQTTTGYIAPLGTDLDGDGLDDAYDADNDSVVGIGGGTGTSVSLTDTDLDGLSDWLDLDSDNDGEVDAIEGHDMNGDGVADVTPSGNDADQDGLDDAYDSDDSAINPTNSQVPTDFADVDLPGVGDMDWRELDNDGDGINDVVDLDDDNDGIPDYVELCGPGATDFVCVSDPSLDDDQDGVINMYDADNCTLNTHGICEDLDTDNDGIPDVFDLDSDNDGIADIVEGGGEDVNNDGVVDNINPDGTLSDDANNDGISDDNSLPNPPDFDNDGQPDFQDLDSDNDGIYDVVEDGGEDVDNNGLVDVVNPDGTLSDDSDEDGWTNTTPSNGQEDTDDDGRPDYIDLDSDNDGIPDIVEGGGDDVNNDGMIDDFNDSNNDGADDNDMTDGLLDTDGDGVADHEDLDSDNDGIADIEEAGGSDENNDGVVDNFTDADGDGWDDIAGTSTPIDTDEDGNPDYTDLDSDNDGINDVIEGHPYEDLGVLDPDGDGVIDNLTDIDGDGWNDVSGSSTGNVPDTDGDGIPDYQDVDSDNDGVNDDVEWDITNDQIGFDDCDQDGVPNYIDADLCGISIPEGFSPNGDGVNDFFVIDGMEYYPNSKLVILNRWGNKVYESTNYQNDWDGKNMFGVSIGGDDLPIGTYFYIFEAERQDEKGNDVEPTKGYVYLNR